MLLVDRENATLGHQLHGTLRLIKVDDDPGIAERYFAQQKPLVLAAARHFVVHPYFARLAKLFLPGVESAKMPLRYEDMVTGRLVAMHTLLSTAGAYKPNPNPNSNPNPNPNPNPSPSPSPNPNPHQVRPERLRHVR